jgi:hypothetical protein
MGELPTNCRIIQCPLYNDGFEQPPPDNNTTFFHDLHQHGIGIHSDLIKKTQDETLAIIGWTRCCTECDQYLFGSVITNEHRKQCNTYQTTQTYNTILRDNTHNTEDDDILPDSPHESYNSDTSEDLLQSNNADNVELSQTSLFDSCPTNRHQDLQVLLNLNTTPASINAKILRWHAEASNVDTNTYDDL